MEVKIKLDGFWPQIKKILRDLIISLLLNLKCGFPQKFPWNIKIPAKIKVFLWLMTRKSILTSGNILKRGWKGSKNYVYCGKDETINHLFFQCSASKLVWSLMKCAFGLNSTCDNFQDCLGRWIRSFSKNDKILVLVGIAAMFWMIWKCRNNIIFERTFISDPMIMIKLMCSLILDWSILRTK